VGGGEEEKEEGEWVKEMYIHGTNVGARGEEEEKEGDEGTGMYRNEMCRIEMYKTGMDKTRAI
jgi:hypothetical protein